MQWMIEAHEELTSREIPRFDVYYSGKFKGLNGNVRYGNGWMEFRLAKEWKDIDEEIRKGLVQHLLCKVYGLRKKTLSINLYEEYLKKAGEYVEKGESDQELVERFNILNEKYFDGFMEQPQLIFGSFSTTRLGTYDYATDTVRISTALKDDQDMLDYVLYHELLHKKHKFTCSGGRTHHHTKEFRNDEKKFHVEDADKKLERYIATQRRKKPRKKRSWFW